MNIEDIKKAAIEHIDNVLDSTIDYTVINNEEDNYEAGRRDALYDFGHDIFKAGAEWRINSVWHDASEAPQYSRMLIALNKKGLPFICGPNNSDWKTTVKIFHIKRWAYVKDLIPNTEE